MPTTLDKLSSYSNIFRRNAEKDDCCPIPLWLLTFSVTLSLVVTGYFTLWHNHHHVTSRNLEQALAAKETENRLLKAQIADYKLRERHYIKKERILEETLTSTERKELADDYERLRRDYFKDIRDFDYESLEFDGTFSLDDSNEVVHTHDGLFHRH
ncbi:hypothetical protein [Vibrio alginolyticus]|uniref:hypothetical protein n=1 Tax=Vibrio alginolyticus TaxID=663 RepID=UPI0006CA6AAB|nr:hypothetical protein [Vibrio alginolyticus]KPM97482.1 hypothetical protein AOG25_13500 [Vibrio alginolyticus]